jgi:FkbM family methyltransferase
MGLGLHKLKFALNHPLVKNKKWATVKRFVNWNISKIISRYPVIAPFVQGTQLIINKNCPGDEMNLYTGLSEFPEMGFLLHFLRETDLFVDIGANVGSFTVLASGVRKCRSITIEPIPATFNIVMDNIFLNNLQDKVNPLNLGAGEKKSILKFTNGIDVLNHVVTEDDVLNNYVEIPVERLDDILHDSPNLLKIDVEGFEMNVLQGATKTLNKPELKGIIIELNGLGKRYGHSDKDLHAHILDFGFKPYSYEPLSRSLKLEQSYITPNTIYLRDLDFVYKRLKEASNVTVMGVSF